MTARDVAVRRFYPWFGRYRRDVAEPFEAINLRDAFVAGWVAGGAYALKLSAKISELTPTLDLFNELLAAELDERVQETEPGLHPDPAHSHRPGED